MAGYWNYGNGVNCTENKKGNIRTVFGSMILQTIKRIGESVGIIGLQNGLTDINFFFNICFLAIGMCTSREYQITQKRKNLRRRCSSVFFLSC